MKRLHRADLFTWSAYNAGLHIDFNSFLWVRSGGNVIVDPLPLTPDDERDLDEAGGASWIVITNSDHVRGARELAARTGAQLVGPRAERDRFPVPCDRYAADGDLLVPGLVVRELQGSKTPGELALVLDETTAFFGDLVRAHQADALMLLPEQKLRGRADALESLRRMRALHPRITHVLVGDGWCSFRTGGVLLDELLAAS